METLLARLNAMNLDYFDLTLKETNLNKCQQKLCAFTEMYLSESVYRLDHILRKLQEAENTGSAVRAAVLPCCRAAVAAIATVVTGACRIPSSGQCSNIRCCRPCFSAAWQSIE